VSSELLREIFRVAELCLLASVLLAWLRNPVVVLFTECVNVAGLGVRFLGQRLRSSARWLRDYAGWNLDGLRYGTRQARQDGHEIGWRGWHLVGPLAWLGAFFLLMFADGSLMYLRLGALLNQPPQTHLNVPFLLAVAWIATIFVYGLLLFELLAVSPSTRPFGQVDGRTRIALLVVATLGIAVAAGAAALSLVWGQLRIEHYNSPGMAHAFLVLLAILLTGALAISGFAVTVSLGVVHFLISIIGWGIANALRLTLELAFWALDATTSAVIAVIELLAWPGLSAWNWLAGFALVRSLHLRQIGWEERPPIGTTFSAFAREDEIGADHAAGGVMEPASSGASAEASASDEKTDGTGRQDDLPSVRPRSVGTPAPLQPLETDKLIERRWNEDGPITGRLPGALQPDGDGGGHAAAAE
jgi:hypothetical protein